MRLTQSHLDVLTCPVCLGPLKLTQLAEAIDCLGCGRQYPIVDELPVLLATRAKQA